MCAPYFRCEKALQILKTCPGQNEWWSFQFQIRYSLDLIEFDNSTYQTHKYNIKVFSCCQAPYPGNPAIFIETPLIKRSIMIREISFFTIWRKPVSVHSPALPPLHRFYRELNDRCASGATVDSEFNNYLANGVRASNHVSASSSSYLLVTA
jgi:hypothetical protein